MVYRWYIFGLYFRAKSGWWSEIELNEIGNTNSVRIFWEIVQSFPCLPLSKGYFNSAVSVSMLFKTWCLTKEAKHVYLLWPKKVYTIHIYFCLYLLFVYFSALKNVQYVCLTFTPVVFNNYNITNIFATLSVYQQVLTEFSSVPSQPVFNHLFTNSYHRCDIAIKFYSLDIALIYASRSSPCPLVRPFVPDGFFFVAQSIEHS